MASISFVGGEIVFTGSLTNSASTGLISGGDAILRVNGGHHQQRRRLAVASATTTFSATFPTRAASSYRRRGPPRSTTTLRQNGRTESAEIGLHRQRAAVVLGSLHRRRQRRRRRHLFRRRPASRQQPGHGQLRQRIAFGAGATLKIELGGTSPGISVRPGSRHGRPVLDGTLAVSLIKAFRPPAGNSFDILDWARSAARSTRCNCPRSAPT